MRMDRQGLVERPLYDGAGRFEGFDAGWCHAGGWSEIRLGPRFFCVDMGGFAFDATLLWSQHTPIADGDDTMLSDHASRSNASGGGVNKVATRAKPWDYLGTLKYMPFVVRRYQHHQRQRERRRQQRTPRGAATIQLTPKLPTLPVKLEWRGGESEFLQALMPRGFPEDLQPLGNCGHDVLVYHNGFLAKTSADVRERDAHRNWEREVHAPTSPGCKEDGW